MYKTSWVEQTRTKENLCQEFLVKGGGFVNQFYVFCRRTLGENKWAVVEEKHGDGRKGVVVNITHAKCNS